MDNTFTVCEIATEVGGAVVKTARVVTDIGSSVAKSTGKVVKHIDDLIDF